MFLPLLVVLLFHRHHHVASGFHNSLHFVRQRASPRGTSFMLGSYLDNLSSTATSTSSPDKGVLADNASTKQGTRNEKAFYEIRKIKQTLTKIETIMKSTPKENTDESKIGTSTPVVTRSYGVSGANSVKKPANSGSPMGSYLDNLPSSSPIVTELSSTMASYLDVLSSKPTSSSPVVSRSYGVSKTNVAKPSASLGRTMGSYLENLASSQTSFNPVGSSISQSSATNAAKQPSSPGGAFGPYLDNLSKPTSSSPAGNGISMNSYLGNMSTKDSSKNPSAGGMNSYLDRLSSAPSTSNAVDIATPKTITSAPLEKVEAQPPKPLGFPEKLLVGLMVAIFALGIPPKYWDSFLSEMNTGVRFDSLMNTYPKEMVKAFESLSTNLKGLATSGVTVESKNLPTSGVMIESKDTTGVTVESNVLPKEVTAESKDVASPGVTVESKDVASPEVTVVSKYLTPSEVTVESKDLSPPEVTADAKDTETSEVTVESKDSTTAKVAVESADMDTKAATEESKDLAPTGVTVESKDLTVSDAVESIAARPTIELLSKDDDVIPSSNSFPAGEDATKAIDRLTSTKYLNFDKINTGFTVTPKAGASVISSISITTANDSPERDPATWQILGSNNGVDFTEIAQGSMKANPARFHTETMPFSNTKSYTSYKVIFPTIVDDSLANSMQVAEVALYGTTV